jgi:phenylpyruvate tautomerase PptA (4-oxalocrotonate tautomerase family)
MPCTPAWSPAGCLTPTSSSACWRLDADDFRFDPSYPDVAGSRNDDFVLIEILWSVGRSVKVKKKLLAELVERLRAAGLDPENAMVVFKETSWENWAFAGGRLIHT